MFAAVFMFAALMAGPVAPPQDAAAFETVGLCYTGAIGMRELLEADQAAGNVQEGDDVLAASLKMVEDAAGARLDEMDSSALTDADLEAIDSRVIAILSELDDQALFALMESCWLDLGLEDQSGA